MSNPFTLSFGMIPPSLIDRTTLIEPLIRDFSQETPPYQAVMISGVRGSGKTVVLTEVSRALEKDPDWIVCNLNPDRDLIQQLAARLAYTPDIHTMIRQARISISIPGVSIQAEGTPIITDTAIALDELLKACTHKGKRVLVAIDEAVPSAAMREFASQFQIFMREGCQIFLVMTGLYDNIRNLQDSSTLTFLYRAPRIDMPPLSLPLMAREYQKRFDCPERTAIEMAAATKGYPFAYQALGWHAWALEDRTDWKSCLQDLDQTLQDLVYEKIWSEVSGKQKDLLRAIARSSSDQVREIREICRMKPGEFSMYRDRLLKKQILVAPAYARLDFHLPRFREFVLRQTMLEEILEEM